MFRRTNLLFVLAFAFFVNACQLSSDDNSENVDSVDNQIEDVSDDAIKIKEDEVTKEETNKTSSEVKKLIGRYTLGELHPNTGYSLEFQDAKGESYFFFPENEVYESLGIKLIDGKSFQINSNYENIDFEITYTEQEGTNEYTGETEMQLNIKSIEEASSDWNSKIRTLCGGMWTLVAEEKDGVKNTELKGSFQIWFHRWVAELYTNDGEEEVKWKVSNDLKTLTILGDKNEEYSVEKFTDTELVLNLKNKKLYFEREAENGD